MGDRDKTKEQLIAELEALRVEVASLKQCQRLEQAWLNVGGEVKSTDFQGIAERQCIKQAQALAIIESLEGAIISKSLDGKILSWNAGAERMFGYAAEEMLGQPISVLVPSDHADDTPKILQKVRQGECVYQYETIRVRKDGQLINVSVTASPIRDVQGYIIAASVIKQDICDRKRTEAALYQCDESISALMQAIPDLIMRVKRDGTRIEIFSGIDNTLKPYPTEVNIRGIFPDHLVQQRLHYIQQAIDTGELQIYEHQIEIDGQLQFEEARIIAAGNDEAFVIIRNISDRRQVEAALRKSEERYRAIVEDQTELICRFLPDSTILFVNDSYCRYFGIKREDVIGKSYQPIIFEKDQEQVAQLVHSMSRDNPTVLIENRVVVNGQVRWTQWVNRIIIDEHNHTIEYQSVGRDITDLKQVEATLRESARRWRSLLDNVQLVVVGLDQQGNVEYVNPFFLKLTGYTQAEVIGQYWFDQFLPSYLKSDVNVVFQQMIRQENFHPHYQNPILTKWGEERLIAWSNTLLHGTEGNPIGTISIGEDVTDRCQLERMKTEFISIVSHELRTPLTSMQAALSLLHENIVDPTSEEGQTIIQIATEGVDRLVRLVNDILDLERLESGRMRLEKRLYNTVDLMTNAVDQMQEMANQSGVILNVSTSSFQIYADSDRLLQVLTNLLSNAIKFSPQDSTIWLTAELIKREPTHSEELTHSICFRVKDQGRGIPANKLEDIFERFHQVDASDSREKGGTGLGLTICRSIIQQHGGRMWAESVFGEGSTFYFTLPAEEEINNGNQASFDH